MIKSKPGGSISGVVQRTWERVQSSDDATRKRIALISSAIVTVVIMLVWLSFFDGFIGGFNEASLPVARLDGGEERATFFGAIQNGFTSLAQTLGSTIGNAVNFITKPGTLDVRPSP